MVLNGMLHHDDVAGFQLSRVLFLWRTISGVRVENLVFRRVSPSEIGILTKQRKQKPNKHHWFSHTYTLCNKFFFTKFLWLCALYGKRETHKHTYAFQWVFLIKNSFRSWCYCIQHMRFRDGINLEKLTIRTAQQHSNTAHCFCWFTVAINNL